MNEDSILNQIMVDNQQKGLSDLSLVEAVNRLFETLNQREQEVLKSRFGLGGAPKETLEAIGKKHQLTRERIRQIETSSISKLKKIRDQEAAVASIRQFLHQVMEEHAGMADKSYLYAILHALGSGKEIARDEYDRYADFMISRLLGDNFETFGSDRFPKSVKIKFAELNHLEELAEELVNKIKDQKKLLATEEIIKLAKSTEVYKANEDKFTRAGNLDLKPILARIIPDFSDTVYEHLPLYNFLRAVADLEQNRFNRWGHKDWREVTPKTINDKIYLVLKNEGKPMYYGDIAKKISELSFDKKGVNVATTHNELILDDKYILVGRGLYGLSEWGYKNGTVADVIAAILEEAKAPLSREDIVKQVMEQRMVKQTTVNLALMNKDRFRKTPENLYELITLNA